MKKVIFIIVIISVLLQYFFGKTRLYYYNSCNLFLSLIPQHFDLTLFIST